MKTTGKLTLILTLFLIQMVVSIANTSTHVYANVEATGNIAGSVWTDENGNGIQELNERPRGMVIVYIEGEGAGVIEGNITDANGYFTFGKLPFGQYKVWSEDAEGNVTNIKQVGINEVRGMALVELPMVPVVHNNAFDIFLPMVAN